MVQAVSLEDSGSQHFVAEVTGGSVRFWNTEPRDIRFRKGREMAVVAIDHSYQNRAVPSKFSLELYRKVLTVFYVEERMKTLARQRKCSFVASSRGHEVTQAGIASLLRPSHDWFFTYYRSKATAVGLGLSLKNIFLGMLGREGDPNSGGRNMPEHFSSRELNLVSQTACTGSQYLPAVGAAKAMRTEGKDAVVYVESGEGATSEGEFFEALNWAVRESLPVLFVIQNNGYAISVPQRTQTASSVRKIAEGFGIRAVEIDGTSFEEIYEEVPALNKNGGPRTAIITDEKVGRERLKRAAPRSRGRKSVGASKARL
jgi:TPP-dependent pyruvate/acetoin dehydrogenase alpha subunit